MKQSNSGDGRSRITKGPSGNRAKVAKAGTTQKALKLKRLKALLNAKDDAQRKQGPNKQADVAGAADESSQRREKLAPAPQLAPTQLSMLQRKMKQKLKGARFRWINETMYTTTGAESFEMVQKDPGMFEEYHQGFAAQVDKWPVNPLDVFIESLRGRAHLKVADMGCGEARLAAAVGKQHTIHSFDLVAHNKYITACNIANVPLHDDSVDMVVFCLALMGTDFIVFVREANRILHQGGELKIAEVVSRISDMNAFVEALEDQGFKLTSKDTSNKMFVLLELHKIGSCPTSISARRTTPLKPCLYKRR
ncbi:25S rRNA (adenine645-N1)-methyltransferase [Coemansia sp. RSA 988]|nr:25S rRNA (adenine645-N1)-methyltransferase [Coemansia sp. RSA 988]